MTYLFSIKIALFFFSITFITIALLYCLFLIEDTKKYANILNNKNPENIFSYVSWTNKKLFAYSQIGHVEKFLDTFIWIFLPNLFI